jgi:MFS transporter, LPLT family, lysophospholipid transporter
MKVSRNYALLLSSQFLSAFGDNAILAVILGPIMLKVAAGQVSPHAQSISNIFYTSLLFVPYLVFAPMAGYFNDRFPKTRGLLLGNSLKVLGACLVALNLSHSHSWLAIGYSIVGIGACMYSPGKYGILPEILPEERLVKANGTVEFLTLVAILCGNVIGAKIVDNLPLPTCYLIVIGIYVFSLLLNCLMTPTPAHPAVPFKGNFRQFWQNAGSLVYNRRLLKILVGTSLFWVCGAMMKMNFQPWGQQVMGFKTATEVALLGLWLSIGVMGGSILAGQLHKLGELQWTRRYGWLLAILIAGIASTRWLIAAGFTHPRGLVTALLIAAGFAAGLFLIPLNAALQAESHKGSLGKTIATQNLWENSAMLCGSAFAFANVTIGFDPSQLFLALAGLVLVISAFLYFPRSEIPTIASTITKPDAAYDNVPSA